MKLYTHKGKCFRANACKSPKFANTLGKNWISVMVDIDNQPMKIYIEEFYGKNYYFKLGDKWYSLMADKYKGGIGDIQDLIEMRFYTQSWRKRDEMLSSTL